MGGKRKQAEADGPAEIDQLACSSSGRGPFAVYFPSGYDPNAEGAAPAWTAYEHTRGHNHYTLVAETVRLVAQQRRMHCRMRGHVGLQAPPVNSACLTSSPHRPGPQGDGKVDFVGSTSSAEYTAPAACRCGRFAGRGCARGLQPRRVMRARLQHNCVRSQKSDGQHSRLLRCKLHGCHSDQRAPQPCRPGPRQPGGGGARCTPHPHSLRPCISCSCQPSSSAPT